MLGEILRIDPALALCWKDVDTLRFGFDVARLRVASPSPALQRIIGALQHGVPLSKTTTTLRRLGATRQQWDEGLKLLAPVLQLMPPPPARDHDAPRIGIVAPDRIATALAANLHRNGLMPERCTADVGKPAPAVVVAVERFLAPPQRLVHAPPTGVPQLPVRLGDHFLRVGPLLSQPGDPCLSCIALHDTDADPALPVLAAQLLDRIPMSETTTCLEAIAAFAVALIRHFLNGDRELGRIRYRIAVRDGVPRALPIAEPLAPHPSCGCSLYNSPASATKREGRRATLAAVAEPETRSASRARVNAT